MAEGTMAGRAIAEQDHSVLDGAERVGVGAYHEDYRLADGSLVRLCADEGAALDRLTEVTPADLYTPRPEQPEGPDIASALFGG